MLNDQLSFSLTPGDRTSSACATAPIVIQDLARRSVLRLVVKHLENTPHIIGSLAGLKIAVMIHQCTSSTLRADTRKSGQDDQLARLLSGRRTMIHDEDEPAVAPPSNSALLELLTRPMINGEQFFLSREPNALVFRRRGDDHRTGSRRSAGDSERKRKISRPLGIESRNSEGMTDGEFGRRVNHRRTDRYTVLTQEPLKLRQVGCRLFFALKSVNRVQKEPFGKFNRSAITMRQTSSTMVAPRIGSKQMDASCGLPFSASVSAAESRKETAFVSLQQVCYLALKIVGQTLQDGAIQNGPAIFVVGRQRGGANAELPSQLHHINIGTVPLQKGCQPQIDFARHLLQRCLFYRPFGAKTIEPLIFGSRFSTAQNSAPVECDTTNTRRAVCKEKKIIVSEQELQMHEGGKFIFGSLHLRRRIVTQLLQRPSMLAKS